MTQPFDSPQFLQSTTGARLRLFHAPARTEAPCAILLIAHGLSEHAARYHRFAEAMAAAGAHVYAHDHRGHGETTAPDAPRGQFSNSNGWEKVLGDVNAVRDHAATRHPGLPVILFGHSMGGLIALNAAISYPSSFDAVAVWNANFHAGLSGRAAQVLLKTERALKGSDVPSAMLARLTFDAWGKAIEGHRTKFDWLSRDAAAVDAYIADPLCGFDATVSLWLDLFHLIYRGSDTRNWAAIPRTMSWHLLAGGADPATDNGKAIAWLAGKLRGAGFGDVSLTIEPDMRHETLNEIDASRAISEFQRWLDRVIDRALHSERTTL